MVVAYGDASTHSATSVTSESLIVKSPSSLSLVNSLALDSVLLGSQQPLLYASFLLPSDSLQLRAERYPLFLSLLAHTAFLVLLSFTRHFLTW